ncbi:hypothetical protein [Leisingera sp.]|uniref:hypothetical protein n=1 Tax=Leisingera sp. TaxID=1879318 RepID=UPI002B272650|nr:hypothetical protein [Leisingera sp.]
MRLFLDLQPFSKNLSWTDATGHPLHCLSAISNQDKHHQLSISLKMTSEISTDCTAQYHSRKTVCQPKSTFLKGKILIEVTQNVIESDFPIKHFSDPDSVLVVAIIEPLRLPVSSFLTELVCNVEAIVENFEKLGKLGD